MGAVCIKTSVKETLKICLRSAKQITTFKDK